MLEERNSLVYDRFVVPVGLHYYGITDDLEKRTKIGSYKRTSLQQYIDEYGWDNITTTIVADGLTRKEAELLEDRLIKEGWEKGDCINKFSSGGEWRDNRKEYKKKQRVKYKEKIKEYNKQYSKIHKRPPETPEKRQKYNKEYYERHKEQQKEYVKKQRSAPEGKIYSRVQTFNKRNPDKAIETPLEARQKYLETGYIPKYIKNDDLL